MTDKHRCAPYVGFSLLLSLRTRHKVITWTTWLQAEVIVNQPVQIGKSGITMCLSCCRGFARPQSGLALKFGSANPVNNAHNVFRTSTTVRPLVAWQQYSGFETSLVDDVCSFENIPRYVHPCDAGMAMRLLGTNHVRITLQMPSVYVTKRTPLILYLPEKANGSAIWTMSLCTTTFCNRLPLAKGLCAAGR